MNFQLVDKIARLSETETFDYILNLLKFIFFDEVRLLPKRTHGVDYIIGKQSHQIAGRLIYKERESDIRAVQEVVSGAIMHDCKRTLIAGGIGENGMKLAEANGSCIVLFNPTFRENFSRTRQILADLVANPNNDRTAKDVYDGLSPEDDEASERLDSYQDMYDHYRDFYEMCEFYECSKDILKQ